MRGAREVARFRAGACPQRLLLPLLRFTFLRVGADSDVCLRREFRLTGSVVGGMQGMSLALRPVLQTSPAGCRAACTAGCSPRPGRSPGSQRLIPARYQAIPPASVHRRIRPRTFGPRRQNSIWCANSRSTQHSFTQCSLQLYVTTGSGTVVVVPIYCPVPGCKSPPVEFRHHWIFVERI